MRENIKKLILGCLLFAGSTFFVAPCNGQAFDEVVKSSYISVRKEAKFNSVIVAKKIRGDRYRMLFEDKYWMRVEFEDGLTGWLFKTVTMKTEPEKKNLDPKETSSDKNKPNELKPGNENITPKKPAAQAKDTPKDSRLPQVAKETSTDAKANTDKPLAVAKPEPPVKPLLVAETSLNAEELYNVLTKMFLSNIAKESFASSPSALTFHFICALPVCMQWIQPSAEPTYIILSSNLGCVINVRRSSFKINSAFPSSLTLVILPPLMIIRFFMSQIVGT